MSTCRGFLQYVDKGQRVNFEICRSGRVMATCNQIALNPKWQSSPYQNPVYGNFLHILAHEELMNHDGSHWNAHVGCLFIVLISKEPTMSGPVTYFWIFIV